MLGRDNGDGIIIVCFLYENGESDDVIYTTFKQHTENGLLSLSQFVL
jgi:hypothetical protein